MTFTYIKAGISEADTFIWVEPGKIQAEKFEEFYRVFQELCVLK